MGGDRSVGERSDTDAAAAVHQVNALHTLFEELGLTSYEARLLVALIRVGEATAAQLSQLSGVSRPNVYLRLEALANRGLAEPRQGKVTRWVSPGATEVVNRLRALNDEKLIKARSQIARCCDAARRVLDELGPEMPRVPAPYVKLLSSELQSSVLYERLMTEVEDDVLVCNRGPYPGDLDLDPAVIDALGRGVRMRALYRAVEVEDASSRAVLSCAIAYEAAGVACRVVDDVPLGLAVFDRTLVLLSLPSLAQGDEPFPTNFAVEHPGFASWCARAFDQTWLTGTPLPASATGPEPGLCTGRRN